MVKKEIYKNMYNNDDNNENLDLLDKGKLVFDIFIGSIPNFIDLLITDLKKVEFKDDEICDITITFNEYINIIESKINILRFYLDKLNYDVNIIINSNYPQTEVKFLNIDKEFIKCLEDAKFLIYCEYHKNLGNA